MTSRLATSIVLLLALLGGAVGLAGCEADTGTVVFVTLRGRLAMQPFSRLDIVVSNQGGTASQTFELGGGDRLPLTFTVTPTGRTGTLSIVATAHFADGLSAGRGSVEVAIVPDKRVNVDLVLEPDDFLVNKAVVSSQFIIFDEVQAGRQIAAAPDGSFVAAFENSCPLERCDVLARLFDKTAKPARNGTTADDGDLTVNQSSLYAESPVIAAGKSGYLVAWVGLTTGRSDADLKATVLRPDGGHLRTFDFDVSLDPANDLAPTVLALSDGSYVVLWERVRADATHEVRARLYSADGDPLVNTVTGTAGDFRVSSSAVGNQVQSHGVGLANGGFVILWVATAGSTGNVFGRIFSANGTPTADDLKITNYTGAAVFSPRAAATQEGFVAGWQANAAAQPALAGKPLIVRRFDAAGAGLSTEIPVVSQTQFFRAAPALAVRASDGAIGVTWPESGEAGDTDMSGGIRFRLLRSTGQPVGDSSVVNTTREGDQVAPSIAAVGDDGFVIGWTDPSGTAPDTFENGVRARVIYPALERHDGKLGAHCDDAADAACADGLTCQPASDGTPLCHAACTNACPGGGTCLNGTYCAFQ